MYILVRTAVIFNVPKQRPKSLSTPFNPITEVILEKIDPKNLSSKKKVKKSIKKDKAFLISSVSIYVSKIGKSKGPQYQAINREAIQAAAEKTSFMNPLKNPVIPKADNRAKEIQSIKTKFSIIRNYLRRKSSQI